jgi:hypothetical protein
VVEALPFVDSASNLLATVEGYGSPGTTCSVVEGSAKTLWYEFIGGGSCMSASVVGNDFDAILAVYEGDDCDRITCVAQTDNYYSSSRGLLSWRAESGTVYKIVVAGAYGAQAGDFLLAIAVRKVSFSFFRIRCDVRYRYTYAGTDPRFIFRYV